MIEFLNPISDEVKGFVANLPVHSLGKSILIHSGSDGIPELNGVSFAIIGVLENRKFSNSERDEINLNEIRKQFYSLSTGNWDRRLVDLGDIPAGHDPSDSRYALRIIVHELLKEDVIPIILGGAQNMVYGQYRAYDNIKKMISLVNVDSRFDIGNAEQDMSHKSYVGKIIFDEPFNLFNYSVLGYQSYYNAPEEIALMDKLFFDAYRLGDVCSEIGISEPVFRNCDIAMIDATAIKSSDLRFQGHSAPNGFDSREVCALARYAGISNAVSSFGIYELNHCIDSSGAMLVAQILWYFIEGVNFRIQDEDFDNEDLYTTYVVPQDDMDLIFVKSIKSNRWWMEMPFFNNANNKFTKQTLLPCTEDDYLTACNQEIPERWIKARLKNEINI